MRSTSYCAATLLLLAMITSSAGCAQAEGTALATGGQALLPIVVAAGAPERVQAAANDLAAYLGRIAGTQFEVTTADGSTGIVVGTAADFPELAADANFEPDSPLKREEYLLRSEAERLLVIGATEIAVEHAVWDLLYRLGYRQYFPGDRWEIVPSMPEMAIEIDVREAPAYHARRIWYGYGTWDYNAEPYAQWCLRNRARSGMELSTGHSSPPTRSTTD